MWVGPKTSVRDGEREGCGQRARSTLPKLGGGIILDKLQWGRILPSTGLPLWFFLYIAKLEAKSERALGLGRSANVPRY